MILEKQGEFRIARVGALVSLAIFFLFAISRIAIQDATVDEIQSLWSAPLGALESFALSKNLESGLAYHPLLSLWGDLFGHTPMSARSLSLLLVFLSSVVLFHWIKREVSSLAAWLSISFFYLNFEMIERASLARPYGLALLCVLVAFYLLRLQSQSTTPYRAVVSLLLWLVGVLAHPSVIFTLPAFIVSTLYSTRSVTISGLNAIIATVIALGYHVTVAARASQISFAAQPSVLGLLSALLVPSLACALLSLIACRGVGLFNVRWRTLSRFEQVILLLWLTPIMSCYILSQDTSIFVPRYYLLGFVGAAVIGTMILIPRISSTILGIALLLNIALTTILFVKAPYTEIGELAKIGLRYFEQKNCRLLWVTEHYESKLRNDFSKEGRDQIFWHQLWYYQMPESTLLVPTEITTPQSRAYINEKVIPALQGEECAVVLDSRGRERSQDILTSFVGAVPFNTSTTLYGQNGTATYYSK